MASRRADIRHAYGWRDFDQEVVEGLVENDSRFINRRGNGWIASPLVGHYDNRLAWKDDNFKKGSVPVGDPPVSFRAAPTYVLERAARQHHRRTRADRRSGRRRVGPPRGEPPRQRDQRGRADVERAPLAAGGGSARCRRERLHGERASTASRSSGSGDGASSSTRAVPWPALQDGPDACLHVPGWGWILIDARFGGGTDTLADAAATEAWLARYSAPAPGLFDDDALRRVRVKDLPHRTLQTIAFAHQPRSRRRAGGRRRARARERVGRSRAVGRPLPRRHRRRRLPPRHLGVALRGARPGRRDAWRRSATTSRTRATASAPRSRSHDDDRAEAAAQATRSAQSP